MATDVGVRLALGPSRSDSMREIRALQTLYERDRTVALLSGRRPRELGGDPHSTEVSIS